MSKISEASRLALFGALSFFLATTFAARQTRQPSTQEPAQAPTSPGPAAVNAPPAAKVIHERSVNRYAAALFIRMLA
jgi:hypothetical protein